MAELEFHKLEDAAKAAGVDPKTLRRWLNEDRTAAKGPDGGVITRRELRASLQKRGRWVPQAIEPFPKVLAIAPSPEQASKVYAALENELPESRVQSVIGPEEALEQVRDFRPDVVMLDARVPGALRLARAIADDLDSKGRLKILVIAPPKDAEAGKAALDAGAAEVLHLPLTPGLLAETLRRMIGMPAPAPTA